MCLRRVLYENHTLLTVGYAAARMLFVENDKFVRSNCILVDHGSLLSPPPPTPTFAILMVTVLIIMV